MKDYQLSEYETEIEWERDPSGLEFLREKSVTTRKKKGIPEKYKDRYIVYGYANLSDDAPTDRQGVLRKRMFYLKASDEGGPEFAEANWEGGKVPNEAVAVSSIEAGSSSTRLNS